VQQVERLVALHVVLPARGAFFAKGGSGIDYSTDEPDWSPVKPISDTFRPLLMDDIDGKAGLLEHKEQEREAKTKIDKKTGSRNPVLKPAELLPIFLDIAIRSVPRDTFRRQTNEGPWLETLFVAIAELAFSAVKQEETADVTSDFISILEQMFRIILNRGVKLSLHTLITHAAYTGVFKDNLDKVQWRLTALLVELGVDIFLPNSGLPDSARLLAALLEKIMLHWTSGYPGGDGMYAKVKTDIVVPLLRGFASARDLLTFVQLWYEQLVLVELARSRNRGLARFSIWESDDLANVCSELMKTSLTEAQVSSLAQNTLSELLSESGAIAVSANAFGRFVTLEAASRNLTCDAGSDRTMSVLRTVIKALVATISSKQNMHWRWRLWRFSGNVLEFAMKSTDGSFDGTLGSLVNSAKNRIRDLHNQPMSRQQDFAEILEAYRFVLTAAEKTSHNTYSNQLALLTADIPPFLKTIVIKEVSVSDASWDGHIETLDSAVSLATGYLVTLLRAPEIWGKTKAETKQALYDQMLSLAAIQQQSIVASSSINSSPLNAQFLQLWNALVSYEYLLNSPEIVNDLLVVLIERLKNDPSIRQLTVMSLQKIPSRFVTRHHRGLLLDFLGHIILEKASPEISGDMLSLMATLANMPKSSAKVTNDWEVVWKIAKAISFKDSEIDFRVMKSFRSLVEAVMSKFVTLSEKDRQKYFKKIHQKTTSSVDKFKSIKHPTLEFYLVRILLSQLWNYRLELSSVFDEASLKSHRQKAFKYLLEDLETLQAQFKREAPNLANENFVAKILAVLEDFEDIVRENDEIEKYMTEIEDCVTKASAGLAASLQRSIKRHVLARTKPGRSLTIPLVKCGDVFSLQHLFAEEQQVLIRDAAERFHEMSADDLTGLIEDIRKSGFSGKNASYRLLIAGLAVTCLKPVEEKGSASSQGLSLLCIAVAESLHTSTSIEQFSLAAECLDILLRCHSRAITQWNVDNILAAVTVAISKRGPQISPEFTGTVYVRLCRLVGVLFVLYRQKLGGRFHLILPAIQRLLTCLFTPNRKRKAGARTKPTQSQPPWLGSLNDSHAVHFTRLLISLCEPTVSAVSKSSQSSTGHEALTDQTKKAKRVAGQHLQYLIIEYTQCTLRGTMNSEIKTALLPGLYAVLDVMSRDTMKALNASLDASGRAVFKTLYDDYVKFGKWNES
jgi:nucleolar pre-ribosomal-associated protein 2